jgi:hypothetical protein
MSASLHTTFLSALLLKKSLIVVAIWEVILKSFTLRIIVSVFVKCNCVIWRLLFLETSVLHHWCLKSSISCRQITCCSSLQTHLRQLKRVGRGHHLALVKILEAWVCSCGTILLLLLLLLLLSNLNLIPFKIHSVFLMRFSLSLRLS